MRLGAHISISGSIDLSIDRALEIGCNTFQIFTRNPRGWGLATLYSDQVERFVTKVKDANINPVIAHMPYLPNLASSKGGVYKKSKESLKLELRRCRMLKIPLLVTHLGSHLGTGIRNGMIRIIDAINEALREIDGDVMLLLENTAGSRNSMGTRFENIAEIIDRIEHQHRVGTCFDTCHAYAAGYDLKTANAVSETLDELDDNVGIERVKVIHLNDSKRGLASKLDRHEHIGLGRIGVKGFSAILANPIIKRLPIILETPIDSRRDDVGNLNMVRGLASAATNDQCM